ncbi:MAG: hypothetical protein ACYCXW_01145 [Solirubrobacteraceae bacterium]
MGPSRGLQLAGVRRSDGRRRLGVLIHVVLAVALVPAFVLLPAPHWGAAQLVLIVALAATATIAEACEIQLIGGYALDGGNAAALVTLVFAGPLAALLVLFTPVVLRATVLWRVPGLGVERKRLCRAGNLSNLASYGWSLIIAYGVLSLASRLELSAPLDRLLPSLGVIVAAGVITSTTQFALGPLLYGKLWDGDRLGALMRPALMALPVDLAMVVLGTASVMLYALIGTPALGCFALIVALPRVIPAAAQAPRASELSPTTAASVYALALAAALGLDRAARKEIGLIMRQACINRETGLLELVNSSRALPPRQLKQLLAGVEPLAYSALMISEPADGNGPARLQPPISARIIAVAEAWAELTAHRAPGLTHAHALGELRAQGAWFDTVVLAAAEAIIERNERPTRVPFRRSALAVPAAMAPASSA